MPECIPNMVFFLVVDIKDNITNLRPGIREYPVAMLPAKFCAQPSFFVDEFVAFHLDFFNEVSDQDSGVEAYEKVSMIGHTMNGEHFCFTMLG